MAESEARRPKWHNAALELSKQPAYKDKPLSIAVRLGVPWRTVVEFLSQKHLVDREQYVMSGSVGFEDYG